LLRFCRSREN